MLMYIELHKAQHIVEIKYQINSTIKNLIRKIILFIGQWIAVVTLES